MKYLVLIHPEHNDQMATTYGSFDSIKEADNWALNNQNILEDKAHEVVELIDINHR